MGRREGIERRAPTPFRIAAAHEARRRIEIVAVGVAALGEKCGILRLAQCRSGSRHGPVGHGILHVVGDRLAEQIAGDVAVFLAQIAAAAVAERRVLHRLVGLFAVEAAEALHDGVGHDDHARIADHAVGLAPHQMPDGQAPLLVVDAEHRIDDIAHLLGVDHRHEGHRRTVGIPQREGRIVAEAGTGVDLLVGAVVVAVDVAELRRRDHRMVERRIEDAAGGLIARLDLHLRQLSVPGRIGRLRGRLEIPSRQFGLHGGLGTLDRHRRKGHLHQKLFAIGRIELDAGVTGIDRRSLRRHLARLLADDPPGRFRELGDEPDPLVLRPTRRIAPAADARQVIGKDEPRIGRLVPASAVLQIENHGGILRGGEGIAVQSDALGSRQFGRHAITGQGHRIVARPGHLPGPVGIGPEARRRVVGRTAGACHVTHDGHHRHVEQIADTGTAQMRVRETDDGRIALVVPRAPVPRLRDARGPQLYEAERHVGPHEDVAVAARTDFGIDVAGQLPVVRSALAAGRGAHGRAGQNQMCEFHYCSVVLSSKASVPPPRSSSCEMRYLRSGLPPRVMLRI